MSCTDHNQKKITKNLLVWWMKYKLGGKIMKEFFGLKAKTYSYLINDGSKDKKQKEQKIVS